MTPAATSGPFAAGWTSVDVTPLVTGNGLISLGLTSPGTPDKGYLSLASRETGGNAPQLVVTTSAAAATDPLVVAAGDIACDPADPSFNGGNGTSSNCAEKATASLVASLSPAAVLTLGDEQYNDGAPLSKWLASYDPAWGQFKAITHPVVGNHEYETGSASGFFQYFGAAVGDPTKGYYSFDLGTWHVVALNGECSYVGGCGAGSPQETWLRADLAAHPAQCTLAYWHEPRFTSGFGGDHPAFDAFWQDLYRAGAEIVLNGHDQLYERFAPQNPAGVADPNGLTEFIVGTGGKSRGGFAYVAANSAARSSGSFGVLALGLHPGSYDWRFVPLGGSSFADSGTGVCHGPQSWSPKQVAAGAAHEALVDARSFRMGGLGPGSDPDDDPAAS